MRSQELQQALGEREIGEVGEGERENSPGQRGGASEREETAGESH